MSDRAGSTDFTKGSKVQLPRGGEMDKLEVYGWVMVDRPGEFQLIDKAALNIDRDYQRDRINHKRVNRIAHAWSWVMLGVLLVARRPDGTFWVFDGQHRKLGADKRSDVRELPCLVFRTSGLKDESKHFLDVNSDRGPVAMIDKFKALLAANDPTAVAVSWLVGADGYQIDRGGGNYTVECPGVLVRCYQQDRSATEIAWAVTVKVCSGAKPNERVILGLWRAQRHLSKLGLPPLTDARYQTAIDRMTVKSLTDSIGEVVAYTHRGGEKSYGEGVIRLLNYKRRYQIPSLLADPTPDAGE